MGQESSPSWAGGMSRSKKSTGLIDSGPDEAGVSQGEDSRVCSWVQQAGDSGCSRQPGHRVGGRRPLMARLRSCQGPSRGLGRRPSGSGAGREEGARGPRPAGKGASLAPPVPVPVRLAPLPDTH